MQPERRVRLNGVVGRNVATYRNERGLSQAELASNLADALGKARVDPTTITRLEAGKRPTTVDELDALAEIFEVSPEMLLRPSAATKGLIQLKRFMGQLHTMYDDLGRLSTSISARLAIVRKLLQDEPDLVSTLTDRDRELLNDLAASDQEQRARAEQRARERTAAGLAKLIPTADDPEGGSDDPTS